MKKICISILVLVIPVMLFGGKIQFQAPDYENPYFRLIIPFETSIDKTILENISINGKDWLNFTAFKDGNNIDVTRPFDTGLYEAHLDYAWKSGKKYTIILSYRNKDSQQTSAHTYISISPEKDGIPDTAKEGFYRSVRLEEPVNMERRAEIVYWTFHGRKSLLSNETQALFNRTVPIKYQTLVVQETFPPEKAAANHPVTLTYKIAFPVDLKPLEKKLFLLYNVNKNIPCDKKDHIQKKGEGQGKTITNSCYQLEFHSTSGQVNIIEYPKLGVKLHNEVGVIHWNPGVFIPGVAWDHSFNWNPAPGYDETCGPLLYINTRRGPLQKIKDVDLEVKYTVEADSPYFLSETLLNFNKDRSVIAVRNDEMVLYNELFDSFIYRDPTGKIIQKPLKEKQYSLDGFAHVAPPDVDWVGLINTEKNYGFFSLRIDFVNYHLGVSGNWLNKPGTYFYAPSTGKYVYWVRPLIYSWSDFSIRNLFTHVPKGSSFYEKNAYIVLPLDKGFTDKLDSLLKRLKNPIWVF